MPCPLPADPHKDSNHARHCVGVGGEWVGVGVGLGVGMWCSKKDTMRNEERNDMIN